MRLLTYVVLSFHQSVHTSVDQRQIETRNRMDSLTRFDSHLQHDVWLIWIQLVCKLYNPENEFTQSWPRRYTRVSVNRLELIEMKSMPNEFIYEIGDRRRRGRRRQQQQTATKKHKQNVRDRYVSLRDLFICGLCLCIAQDIDERTERFSDSSLRIRTTYTAMPFKKKYLFLYSCCWRLHTRYSIAPLIVARRVICCQLYDLWIHDQCYCSRPVSLTIRDYHVNIKLWMALVAEIIHIVHTHTATHTLAHLKCAILFSLLSVCMFRWHVALVHVHVQCCVHICAHLPRETAILMMMMIVKGKETKTNKVIHLIFISYIQFRSTKFIGLSG